MTLVSMSSEIHHGHSDIRFVPVTGEKTTLSRLEWKESRPRGKRGEVAGIGATFQNPVANGCETGSIYKTSHLHDQP